MPIIFQIFFLQHHLLPTSSGRWFLMAFWVPLLHLPIWPFGSCPWKRGRGVESSCCGFGLRCGMCPASGGHRGAEGGSRRRRRSAVGGGGRRPAPGRRPGRPRPGGTWVSSHCSLKNSLPSTAIPYFPIKITHCHYCEFSPAILVIYF